MKLGLGGAHLTYCTNIHAGETWDQVRGNIETHVTAVKRRVCPDRPMGLGLRLGGAAARGLAQPGALAALRELLAREGLYVFTINAFPYGPFHGAVVKEEVYRPDWLEDERLRYADLVAGQLDQLLPPGLPGSVSTVPGCFRARAQEDGAPARIGVQLARHAATLWRIAERSGRRIGLALEPEPECLFETTAGGVTFLEEHLFSAAGRAAFVAETGLPASAAEAALRRHVGLCLDACHAAVEFEDPAAAVAGPAAAGIQIFKLQVSAGLRVPRPDAGRRQALEPFAEGVYLHQVVMKRGSDLHRVLDLPAALEQARTEDPGEEWRIHFHVPIFRESLGPFASTQTFLSDLLAIQARTPFTDHLEVETYTWDVLPAEHRGEPVADAVARELKWTLARLGETQP
jgi:sugar phosphate isomerase/epimerase